MISDGAASYGAFRPGTVTGAHVAEPPDFSDGTDRPHVIVTERVYNVIRYV